MTDDSDILALLPDTQQGLFAIDEAELAAEAEAVAAERRAQARRRRARRIHARRAKSEAVLAEVLPARLTMGESWHVMSCGDVDALSYLAHILRAQPLDYLLFSTWCMAMADCIQMRDWLASGRIGRIDAYVGEIFPSQYPDEHAFLCDAVRPYGGRVAVFRNHAKVMAGASLADGLYFVIESSANINTNPRAEQTAIHADRSLFDFYSAYFDGIHSFNRDFDDWEPWRAG